MTEGFIKVASAVPTVRVADCRYNTEQIKALIDQSEAEGIEIVVFPELCITGYTCQDLFFQQALLAEAKASLKEIADYTAGKRLIAIVGLPVSADGCLYNCAAIVNGGSIEDFVTKTFLPNYNEFYEQRWFTSADNISAQAMPQFEIDGKKYFLCNNKKCYRTQSGVKFGVELCEDLWSPIPPSTELALAGAEIIFNLSASNELIGKHDYLRSLIAQQSARTLSAYVYSSSGYGESTQDVVYGGNSIIYENGKKLSEGKRFTMECQLMVAQVDTDLLHSERSKNTSFRLAQKHVNGSVSCLQLKGSSAESDAYNAEANFKLTRYINPHPFIPSSDDMRRSCEEIFSIQVMGLAKRIEHTHSKRLIIGISGGLDSTLALLVCARTYEKLHLPLSGIIGVTMPGFGTTDRTYNNALSLMRHLGVTIREINIAKSVTQHFEDIGHDASVHDITYENSQARERTQILMDLSNQLGGLVIGTGDLSELALGWATYNGDHMSMYGVNCSIPKTLIRHLVQYVADYELDGKAKDTLMDIIDTPISPELIPADEQGNIKQKTEDLVGPYELHDFFIYNFLRYNFRPRKLFLMAQRAFAGVYDDATIKKWLKTFLHRFFAQQFKRSCLPDGPKVGTVSLSPRGDWRMPSDASAALWLEEAENL